MLHFKKNSIIVAVGYSRERQVGHSWKQWFILRDTHLHYHLQTTSSLTTGVDALCNFKLYANDIYRDKLITSQIIEEKLK
jgi:hypothetical protein